MKECAIARLAVGDASGSGDTPDRRLLAGFPGESNAGTCPRFKLPSSINFKQS